MILDLSDELGVVWQDKVDSNTFSTETSCSTDSVNVVFFSRWKFIIDDETNLLYINTSCKKISGNKHSSCSCSELSHNCVSLDLVHLTMHGWNSEVIFVHCFL